MRFFSLGPLPSPGMDAWPGVRDDTRLCRRYVELCSICGWPRISPGAKTTTPVGGAMLRTGRGGRCRWTAATLASGRCAGTGAGAAPPRRAAAAPTWGALRRFGSAGLGCSADAVVVEAILDFARRDAQNLRRLRGASPHVFECAKDGEAL